MPTMLIAGRPVEMTIDELIEYETKRERALVADRAVVADAIRSVKAKNAPTQGEVNTAYTAKESAPDAVEWSAAQAKLLRNQLEKKHWAVVLLMAGAAQAVSAESVAEASGSAPKGVGSVMDKIRRCAGELGLPEPFVRHKAKDRSTSFEATSRFRAAVRELSVSSA